MAESVIPSCCVSSLTSAWKAIAKLGEFQTAMKFVLFHLLCNDKLQAHLASYSNVLLP